MLRLKELGWSLLKLKGDLTLCGPGEMLLELLELLEKGLLTSCENLWLPELNLVFVDLRSELKFLFCDLSNRFHEGVACMAHASAS